MPPVHLGDDPLAVYGLACDLLDCAVNGIDTAIGTAGSTLTLEDRPSEIGVSPRVPDLDACCKDGGMAYSYLEAIYATDGQNTPFPQQHSGHVACPSPAAAATFVIGYARCVDVKAEGVPAARDQAVAEKVLQVAWAMWRGVQCCLIDWYAEIRLRASLGILQIVPDEGPCAGYEMRVTVRLPTGCSCP